MGEMGGFDAVALQKYHWVERIDHVHTPGNSSGIVDGEPAGTPLGAKAEALVSTTGGAARRTLDVRRYRRVAEQGTQHTRRAVRF